MPAMSGIAKYVHALPVQCMAVWPALITHRSLVALPQAAVSVWPCGCGFIQHQCASALHTEPVGFGPGSPASTGARSGRVSFVSPGPSAAMLPSLPLPSMAGLASLASPAFDDGASGAASAAVIVPPLPGDSAAGPSLVAPPVAPGIASTAASGALFAASEPLHPEADDDASH